MIQSKWFQAVVFLWFVAAFGTPGLAKAAQGIEGTYACAGTNPGNNSGTGYKGTATIAKAGDTYSMSWTINGESFTGIGIRNGSSLSVSWYAAGKTGIVVYRISAGGSPVLKGQWASLGGNGLLGTETLVR